MLKRSICLLILLAILSALLTLAYPDYDENGIPDLAVTPPAGFDASSLGEEIDNALEFTELEDWDPAVRNTLSEAQIERNWQHIKGKEDLFKNNPNFQKVMTKMSGQQAQVDVSQGPVNAEPVQVPDSSSGGSAQGMHFEQLSSARFNDVVLTNAQDVTVTPSQTCGADAESILIGDFTIQSNVQNFCIDAHNFVAEVAHADEVMVKCDNGDNGWWRTTNIDDATLTVDDFVRVETDREQELKIRDCSHNDLDVTFKGEGSRASFARDGGELLMDKVIAEFENSGADFIVSEWLNAEGSARVVLDRETGNVLFIEMEPLFEYQLRTGKPATDFAFEVADSSHTLFVRRSEKQTVSPSFIDCTHCTVVDIPGRALDIKGDIAYQRKWIDTAGNPLNNMFVTIYKADNPDAVAKIVLDPSYTFIHDLLIQGENPPVTTRISNYLTVRELAVGNETHRLFHADEKLPKELLAQNIVTNYRTSYSDATMTITNNLAEYERGTLNVGVMPPGDVADLAFAGLLSAYVALVMGLIIVPLRNKGRRGQLTVFVILGLVLVIVVAIILLSGDLAFDRTETADTAGVNKFLSSCLDKTSKDSLRIVGAQGGAMSEPLTQWFDHEAQPLNVAEVERSLRLETQKRMLDCADSLELNFKGIERVDREINGETVLLNVGTRINDNDVLFTVHYPIIVRLVGGDSFTADDQRTSAENTLLQTITLATTTVQSQEDYDDFVDLDALEAEKATMTFLPQNDEFVTLILDDAYAEKGYAYQFAFGSRR